MSSRSSFYADGLRWIGSLFNDAADHLEQPGTSAAPLEPLRRAPSFDDFLGDTRHRVYTRL